MKRTTWVAQKCGETKQHEAMPLVYDGKRWTQRTSCGHTIERGSWGVYELRKAIEHPCSDCERAQKEAERDGVG